MLFAIKYSASRKGIKVANESLNRYGGAIMFSGRNTGVFFTNPFVASLVAHRLQQVNKQLEYRVYKLSSEEARVVSEDKIVSSMEEYRSFRDKETKKANEQIRKLKQQMGLEDEGEM